MPRPPKAKTNSPAERRTQTAGVNFPLDVWTLLHKVAFARALKEGGRPSISKLLVELVRKHQRELEKELGG
jgi:hypothetical protein